MVAEDEHFDKSPPRIEGDVVGYSDTDEDSIEMLTKQPKAAMMIPEDVPTRW